MKDKPKKTQYSEDFEKFWQNWPKERRVAKPNAYKAFKKIDLSEMPVSVIIAAVIIQKQPGNALNCDDLSRVQYCPHPATWLNAERWTDYVQPSNEESTYGSLSKEQLEQNKQKLEDLRMNIRGKAASRKRI